MLLQQVAFFCCYSRLVLFAFAADSFLLFLQQKFVSSCYCTSFGPGIIAVERGLILLQHCSRFDLVFIAVGWVLLLLHQVVSFWYYSSVGHFVFEAELEGQACSVVFWFCSGVVIAKRVVMSG